MKFPQAEIIQSAHDDEQFDAWMRDTVEFSRLNCPNEMQHFGEALQEIQSGKMEAIAELKDYEVMAMARMALHVLMKHVREKCQQMIDDGLLKH